MKNEAIEKHEILLKKNKKLKMNLEDLIANISNYETKLSKCFDSDSVVYFIIIQKIIIKILEENEKCRKFLNIDKNTKKATPAVVDETKAIINNSKRSEVEIFDNNNCQDALNDAKTPSVVQKLLLDAQKSKEAKRISYWNKKKSARNSQIE